MHKFCHSAIHAVFSNEVLAEHLNTVEKLKGDSTVKTLIAWIKGLPEKYLDEYIDVYLVNEENNENSKDK